MFALFFLYVLIIAVAVFVLKLILWILLIPILWTYFTISDAIGRKKKRSQAAQVTALPVPFVLAQDILSW